MSHYFKKTQYFISYKEKNSSVESDECLKPLKDVLLPKSGPRETDHVDKDTGWLEKSASFTTQRWRVAGSLLGLWRIERRLGMTARQGDKINPAQLWATYLWLLDI